MKCCCAVLGVFYWDGLSSLFSRCSTVEKHTEHEHKSTLMMLALTGRVEVKMAQWYEIDNVGYALNNLGSVYVDCGKLDLAADCYINALKIRHTRAHQGLARVHFLRNDKIAAYEEMTKLIEKAQNNASAYEKRSSIVIEN
ncbi:hypothetical protein NC651_005200 [Populus alba x Populus x berolinensis]|nr:hypothetical protein NC651_005200 [Populus alba x Populus x berolinensis]